MEVHRPLDNLELLVEILTLVLIITVREGKVTPSEAEEETIPELLEVVGIMTLEIHLQEEEYLPKRQKEKLPLCYGNRWG